MRPSLASRILGLLLLATLLAGLLILPDPLYGLFNPAYQARFSLESFAVYWVFALLMAGLRRGWAFGVTLGFLALMQLSQFLHFTYFGTLISPHEVVFLFNEWGEIWLTLQAVLPYIAMPLLIVAGCAALAWIARTRGRGHVAHLPFAGLGILLLLSILPYRAYQGAQSQRFYPNPKDYSIGNTLHALSYFVGQGLRDGGDEAPAPRFLPYRLERLAAAPPPTIVVVMGESLTYKHMSLFGYDRQTTPRLDAMRADPAFAALPAIAGAVSTKVSLPSFFNVQREPGNLAHLMRYETNLIKMAKERGLATHYISAQTANLATYSGSEFADQFVTQEEMGELYEREKDLALLRYVERMDLSRPSFVVLHQRNSHGPYEKSSPREFDAWPVAPDADRRTYTVNTYDNSIRFTDHFLHELIQTLRERTRGPAYLFVLSDHGEMMGEGGKYGHNMLEPGAIHVPFLFYALRGDDGEAARMRAMQTPTHYEIGIEIARLLGYRITNPNATPGRFYVNGLDLGNRMGCLALDKDPAAPDGWRPAADPLCATR